MAEGTRLNMEARSEITRLMRETGCSRSDLARLLGVSRVCITQMFDPSRNLTLDTVERVAQALGYTVHLCCHEQPRKRR